MKEFDLEKLSREMPYKMPEHFLDDMTERVVSQIGKQRKQRKERKFIAMFAGAASAAVFVNRLMLNNSAIGIANFFFILRSFLFFSFSDLCNVKRNRK